MESIVARMCVLKIERLSPLCSPTIVPIMIEVRSNDLLYSSSRMTCYFIDRIKYVNSFVKKKPKKFKIREQFNR